MFQYEVSLRSLTVQSRTDKGDDGECPQRGKLDEYGDDERCNDGKPRGRYAYQIASVQWTTDDHVPTHGDDDGQPSVRLGAGVLYKRTIDGCQDAQLFVVRVRGGVVVSTERDSKGRDTAEQIGDGQTDQSGPRCPLDPTAHGRRHATLAHDHYRHDVADNAKYTERRNNDGRYNDLELVDSRTDR